MRLRCSGRWRFTEFLRPLWSPPFGGERAFHVRFSSQNQILLSSCFCLLLSLYILTAAARGQLKNDPIGPILLWIMRPLQIAAQTTTNWLDEIRNSYSMLAGYKSENEKLENGFKSWRLKGINCWKPRLRIGDCRNF